MIQVVSKTRNAPDSVLEQRVRVWSARTIAALFGLLALVVFVQPLVAQTPADRGTVTGRILTVAGQQPISQVQISLVGTGIGTLSDVSGRFTLRNVPPGAYEIRLDRIGYASETRSITVEAGQVTVADFTMTLQALGLDEVVVTGTAGAARRREMGSTVSQINMAEVDAPPVSLDQLLQGRSAGVSILPSSGMAGSGAQIRLRGNVSVAMSNQPIVYIDGVRVRSDGYPKNAATLLDRDIRGSNDAVGPLGDINPADIERIEIIKGSAATTLYGTEAAAGVIQIFTKRGLSGAPIWNVQVDQGVQWLQNFGTAGNPKLGLDPWLRNAHSQTYNISVQGGTEALGYFVSTSLEDSQGVLPNDQQDRFAVRGNLTFQPLKDLQVQWNTSYTKNYVATTASGNNSMGIPYNAYTSPAGFVRPDDIPRLLEYEVSSDISRIVTGGTFTYAPTDRLTNRVTVGFDRADLEGRNYRPFGFVLTPDGLIQTNHWKNEILTVDYVSTLRLDLPAGVRSSVSWGAQSITSNEVDVVATSRRFPGPGLATVSSGAEQLAGESRKRVVNAGVFGQGIFDFRDRYFLTIGGRLDGNSAFGSDFGLQFYPKVSASYVISDESFWPESLGDLKLRAAVGESGRAPGVFDAVRTWTPIGWGGDPALAPLQVGNPLLGPERTREYEAGFDGSLMDGRLTTEVSYYYQKTFDALLPVTQIPSMGFVGSQLENVGELENRGWEVSLRGVLVERPGFTADLGLRVSTNHSKALSLGTATPFTLEAEGWVIEGQPVPVIRAPRIMNPDDVATPVIELHTFGPNLPTHIFGIDGQLQLPGGLRLSAIGEYQGGHYIKNRAFRTMAQRGVAPQCAESGYYDIVRAGRVSELPAFWQIACVPTRVDNRMFIVPADFFKLRTVTASLPVPVQLPGSSSALLTIAGYNLFSWLNPDLLLLDPEMAGNSGMLGSVREIVETIPPPSRISASLKITF
jgi:TonB-dependent starch-binding outer membrane protein SusC